MTELTESKLSEITERPVHALHPKQVVLFGSHVWGQPHKDSDADLLVIVEKEEEPGLPIRPKTVRPGPVEGPFMVRQAHHERLHKGLTAKWTIRDNNPVASNFMIRKVLFVIPAKARIHARRSFVAFAAPDRP